MERRLYIAGKKCLKGMMARMMKNKNGVTESPQLKIVVMVISETLVIRGALFSGPKFFLVIKSENMKKIALLVFPVLLITGSTLSAQDIALKTNLLYDATTTMNLGYEVALSRRATLDIWVNYNPWTLGRKWVGIKDAGESFVEKRDSKLKHFMIQPEIRWWLCEKFNGHFFGVHVHGGLFNVGAIKMPFGWGRYKDDESGNFLGTYPVEMTTADGKNIKGIQYEKGTVPYQGLVDKYDEGYARNQVIYSNADRDGIYTNSFEGWFAGMGVSYGYHWVLSPRFSMEFTAGVGYAYLNYEKARCTSCKQVIGEDKLHYFGPTRAGISLIYMLK
jgi:hypothetical protein